MLSQVIRLFGRANPPGPLTSVARWLHITPATQAKSLPPRPKVSESDIDETFVKGSGPGGQKINKTSSAVQLKHLPSGMVVKSQATRSRSQNRKIARTLLAEKLEVMEKGPQSRTEIKRDTARRKKNSSSKKSRRKYRKLEEEASNVISGKDEGAE